MATGAAQTPAEADRGAAAGTLHVVDPSPLNWLFITWNTMEEPIRGAVPAQEESHAVTLAEGVPDAIRCSAHHVDDGFQVLGSGPCSVGAPGNDRRIPKVAHSKARADKRFNQPGIPQLRRRAFLADAAGARTRGTSDDR